MRTKAQLNAYQKRWRRENPEKTKLYHKRWDPTGDKTRKKSRESWHRHKEKRIAETKAWLKVNPTFMKSWRLQKLYGITFEDYKQMMSAQKSKCKICKQTSDSPLHVDHNHKTTKIRGLLCRRCNTLLGLAFDKIRILRSAILYLKNTS